MDASLDREKKKMEEERIANERQFQADLKKMEDQRQAFIATQRAEEEEKRAKKKEKEKLAREEEDRLKEEKLALEERKHREEAMVELAGRLEIEHVKLKEQQEAWNIEQQ